MVGYEGNTGGLPVLKEKYVAIPQWSQKEKCIVGVKGLHLVHTEESDYWIRQRENKYDVYEQNLKDRLYVCESREEAVEYIKDILKLRKKVEAWYKED